jgi:hypothetical protein
LETGGKLKAIREAKMDILDKEKLSSQGALRLRCRPPRAGEFQKMVAPDAPDGVCHLYEDGGEKYTFQLPESACKCNPISLRRNSSKNLQFGDRSWAAGCALNKSRESKMVIPVNLVLLAVCTRLARSLERRRP